MRSRSRVRAALGVLRRRPNRASSARREASSSAGASALSTAATPLTYHGWSEGGIGCDRYQRERRTTVMPCSGNCATAAFTVYGEVLNLTNHYNSRFVYSSVIDPNTGQAQVKTLQGLPVTPTAGIVFQF